MTPSEVLLWSRLQKRRLGGYLFRRQYPAGPYFLDFYCPARRLAVELDGGGHATDDQRGYDEERSRFLEGKRIRVIRFWNHDVQKHLEQVITRIHDALGESGE